MLTAMPTLALITHHRFVDQQYFETLTVAQWEDAVRSRVYALEWTHWDNTREQHPQDRCSEWLMSQEIAQGPVYGFTYVLAQD